MLIKSRLFGGVKFRIWTSFAIVAIIIGSFFLMVPQAEALHFDFKDGVSMDLDTTVIYGVSMRMKDPDDKLLADINADDGNRAFEQYELVSNRLTARTDMDFKWNNLGLFARGRAFYDYAYNGSNSNDSPATNNNGPIFGGPLKDNDDFNDQTISQLGRNVELLDFFVYGNFDLGGHKSSIRIGKQVVSWGESLFTLGSISSAQGTADATMLNTPGAELKDIFLPTRQILAEIELVKNLSFSGYYQWEWEKHRSDPVGSFFNYMDFADRGGYHQLAVPGLPVTADRISDNHPKNGGQWGIALRYLAPWLNDTEFGLYFLNYHEKFPQAKTKIGAGTMTIPDWGNPMLNFVDSLGYYLDYQSNIKLYGVSFSSQVGETNISGELSYRDEYEIPVVDPNPTNLLGYQYQPFDVVEGLVSIIHVFGPVSFVDMTTLMFEVGLNQVLDGENLYKDSFAWGSMTSLSFSFLDVMPFLDMKVPVSFKSRPSGNSSLPGTFTEDRESYSVGVEFTYKNNLTFGLKYTDFMGKPEENPQSDRDYLSFSTKYTF